ncbi:hypothetical protein [Natronorubrum bangense]|uniref:hypothetical protein n=1 Tax=Natronorubrum bangense TaxID=61858 RepID=UPI000A99CA6A|nr:hypothetical protein [Natronorubrum bangense]
MTSEFDLPCSACGGDLREATIESHELGLQVETEMPLLVAECRTCGERHYPEGTLATLRGHTSWES